MEEEKNRLTIELENEQRVTLGMLTLFGPGTHFYSAIRLI